MRLRALTLTDGRGGALTAAPARLETRVWMPFATPRTDVTVRMTRSTEVVGGVGGGGDGAASAAPAGASSSSSAASSSWLSPAAAAATSAAPTGIALQVTPAQYAQLLRTVSQNFAPLEYSVEALAVDEFSGLCVPPGTFPPYSFSSPDLPSARCCVFPRSAFFDCPVHRLCASLRFLLDCPVQQTIREQTVGN